ncbi:MAG: hypothetical protein ACXWMJ_03525 [Syntrophales bacterium]
MKYFLATYTIRDGEHEHKGAIIFAAETLAEAATMAEAEDYTPETDKQSFYFSFGGDGMTACENSGCQEVTKEHMEFLEQVGLAYRK